jgi:hypothetical protein
MAAALGGRTVNHLAAVPSRAHLVSAATRADRGPHRLPGGTSLLGLESDKNWPGVAELIVAVYPKRSEVSRMRIARNGSKAGPAPCRCHSAGLDDPAVNQVVWVYAVAADLDPGRLSGLTGVGGEPVRAVAEGDLCAVVGSVDAAVFGEKSLASLLADQTNIEMIGRAHHQVVAGVASDGPVVPLRLATIYPDDLTVRVLLAERLTELAVMLESFRGTEEWGVKVHVEPWTDGGDGDPGAVSSSDPDGTPVRGPRWQEAEDYAQEIDRTLSDIAIATRRHAAPYPRFGDIEGWTVHSGVYLLDTERAAEFTGIVRKLTEERAGLRADVTGPWPPYSFADRQEV